MKKATLRATAAWQALALVGAGASTAFIAAAPAAAQDYTRGNLVGTIQNDDGSPVSGATVTVTSNAQGYSSTTTTDASGGFRVVALATGTYTLTVESGGQTVVNDPAVTVLAGQNNTFAYIAGTAEEAAAAADDETIVILGTRVQVDDFASTQTGATIDVTELAETVPVGRNANSLIQLAPGTVAGDGGFGNLTSISGATVAENAYYINGLNVTDFRGFLGQSDIPFEFYQTLDVKTGGYPAEYGRALGGVTSAVTKSGSNTLKGGAVIAYTPDALRETSPNTYLSYNDLDYTTNLDASFYLSGPIIKDRLFFYGIYNPGWFESRATGATAGLRARVTDDSAFWGGKIDAILFDGHRVEFTYFDDSSTAKTAFNVADFTAATDDDGLNYVYNGLGELTGNVINKDGGENWVASYTGQFTDFFTLSLSYGESHDVSTQSAAPNIAYAISRMTGCTPVCLPINVPAYQVQGTVIGDVTDINDRTIYRADADLYVDFLGSHHFRGGFDYEKLEAGENTFYTGAGYRYDFRRNLAVRRLYANTGFFETNMRAFYLQDSWSLMDDRINLQLGIRNDRFRNYTQDGDLYYDSGDQWGPRLGATIDVFGDKRTKLNVFWGRYFLPIATNTNIRLAGKELYVQQVDIYGFTASDANGDGIPDHYNIDGQGDVTNFNPNLGGACPQAYADYTGLNQFCQAVFADGTLAPVDALVNADLEPSKSDEWLIGVSHRIGDWTFGVDYVNRRLGQTLEDVAIDKAANAYCEGLGYSATTCSSIWSGFHQYVLTNPGYDMTVRLDGDCTLDTRLCDVVTLSAASLGYPEAVRKYDAVQFTVDKAFNGLYGFNASYTYTDLTGNFEGGVKSDNNQTDTGLTQDFDQPGFLDGAYGDLANGRKHSFKFFGHIKPVDWLDVGMNVLVESPRKFSCIGNYQNDSSTFEYSYGAASYWCLQEQFGGAGDAATPGDGTGSVLVPRGTAFKSEWNKRVDLGVAFDLAPLSLPGSQFRIDVFNVFNWQQKLDFNEFGDINRGGVNLAYGRVTGYQAPRSVRFTLAMRFGEE